MSVKHSYFFLSGSSCARLLLRLSAVVPFVVSSAGAAEPPKEPEAAENKVVSPVSEVETEASAPSSSPPSDTTPSDPVVQKTDEGAPSEATLVENTSEKSEEAAAEESVKEGQDDTSASDHEGWMKLEESSAKLEEKPKAPKPFFRTMLLIEGAARYGAVTIAPPGTTLEEEDPDAFESRVGNLGGQVTLGVMPGGSAFTMAGRLRGGSYISEDFTRGNVAAEMLFGANFGRNARGNEFTYILGGFGVEFLPGENQDVLTLNIGAATVVKGVSFGGGILLGANDEIALGTIGMQIGWGQLF